MPQTVASIVESDSFYDAGKQSWYKTGVYPPLLHRTNGPAKTTAAGTEKWYLNGERHRIGGPAIKFGFGRHEWWVNGLLHRVDGPALTWVNTNREEWYLNGERHRIGGPAHIFHHGTSKAWWVNGRRHRLDGPAVENADSLANEEEYWVCGNAYSKKNFQRIIDTLSLAIPMNQIVELPYEILETIFLTIISNEDIPNIEQE